MTKRNDKSKKPETVDEYVASQSGEVHDILVALRGLVKSTLPRCGEQMKWGVPAYATSDACPFCYLYAGRDHANLGFLRGAELPDSKGLLEGKGEEGRHIKIFAVDEMPRTALRALLRAAYRQAHG